MYARIGDIDWNNWKPTEKATLLFVLREGEVLLIEKKTGLGAGKINGPGGRIEPGESALDAAIREVEEELCVTPTDVKKCGELLFQFVDGYGLHVSVFTARGCIGVPRETREAAPLWTSVEQIPYHRMWADDKLWFPLMLDGKGFHGVFIFDGDTMLDHRVKVLPCPEHGADHRTDGPGAAR